MGAGVKRIRGSEAATVPNQRLAARRVSVGATCRVAAASQPSVRLTPIGDIAGLTQPVGFRGSAGILPACLGRHPAGRFRTGDASQPFGRMPKGAGWKPALPKTHALEGRFGRFVNGDPAFPPEGRMGARPAALFRYGFAVAVAPPLAGGAFAGFVRSFRTLNPARRSSGD